MFITRKHNENSELSLEFIEYGEKPSLKQEETGGGGTFNDGGGSNVGGGDNTQSNANNQKKLSEINELLRKLRAEQEKLLTVDPTDRVWVTIRGEKVQVSAEQRLGQITSEIQSLITESGQILGYGTQETTAGMQAGATVTQSENQLEGTKYSEALRSITGIYSKELEIFQKDFDAINADDNRFVQNVDDANIDRARYLVEQRVRDYLEANGLARMRRFEPSQKLLAAAKAQGIDLGSSYERYDHRDIDVGGLAFVRETNSNEGNIFTKSQPEAAPFKLFYISRDIRQNHFNSYRPDSRDSYNANESTDNKDLDSQTFVVKDLLQPTETNQSLIHNQVAQEIYRKRVPNGNGGTRVAYFSKGDNIEIKDIEPDEIFAQIAITGRPRIHNPAYTSNSYAVDAANKGFRTKRENQFNPDGSPSSATADLRSLDNSNAELDNVFMRADIAEDIYFNQSLPEHQRKDFNSTFAGLIQDPFQRRLATDWVSPYLENSGLMGILVRLIGQFLFNDGFSTDQLPDEEKELAENLSNLSDETKSQLLTAILNDNVLTGKEKQSFLEGFGGNSEDAINSLADIASQVNQSDLFNQYDKKQITMALAYISFNEGNSLADISSNLDVSNLGDITDIPFIDIGLRVKSGLAISDLTSDEQNTYINGGKQFLSFLEKAGVNIDDMELGDFSLENNQINNLRGLVNKLNDVGQVI